VSIRSVTTSEPPRRDWSRSTLGLRRVNETAGSPNRRRLPPGTRLVRRRRLPAGLRGVRGPIAVGHPDRSAAASAVWDRPEAPAWDGGTDDGCRLPELRLPSDNRSRQQRGTAIAFRPRTHPPRAPHIGRTATATVAVAESERRLGAPRSGWSGRPSRRLTGPRRDPPFDFSARPEHLRQPYAGCEPMDRWRGPRCVFGQRAWGSTCTAHSHDRPSRRRRVFNREAAAGRRSR
jgi:hypothetical protein